jgi:hypothetical protein
MMDKRILDVIRSLAAETGTPGAVVEAVVARLLLGIRLVPQEGPASSPGASRLGGRPDLPPPHRWPRITDAWNLDPDQEESTDELIPFVLQINLAELATLDLAGVLPSAGLLSFFFLLDEEDPEFNAGFAHYTPDIHELRAVDYPADLLASQRYRERALLPCLEWTAPSWADSGRYSLDDFSAWGGAPHWTFWHDLPERLALAQGLESPLRRGATCHRLLGHPQLIQSPGLAEGTRLLLQVDSDPEKGSNMTWADAGSVYFLIGASELKAHAFGSASPMAETH